MLTSDVARALGVAKETVLQLERNGKLTASRTVGGRRLFYQFDVLRLKAEREKDKANV